MNISRMPTSKPIAYASTALVIVVILRSVFLDIDITENTTSLLHAVIYVGMGGYLTKSYLEHRENVKKEIGGAENADKK
jgi:uncharacterized membrane protein